MADFRLYKTARWRAIRAAQLAAEPLCRYCAARGVTRAATVCDHLDPHRGDEAAFWMGPFQSLCQPCHSGGKQSEELHGFRRDVGLDGWPVDPRHSANRKA